MSDTQGADGAQTDAAAPKGDIEATARRMGWRPKEEFKGDEAKWVEADTFVAKIQDEVPLLKRTLRDMDAKFAKQEKKLEEAVQVLSEFRDFASKGEERAYQRAMTDLLAKREVAVASADTAAFHSAQADIDKLNAEAKAATTPKKPVEETEARTVPAPPKAITDWMDDNPWYSSDTLLHNVAKGIDATILKEQPGLGLSDRLAKVKAEVMARFPEKFGVNTRRDAPGAVGASDSPRTTAKRGGKSYDDLPPDAKRACDKFVKTIPKFTREQYLKTYAWGEA